MPTEILVTLLAAGLSSLIGASRFLLVEDIFQRAIRRILKLPEKPKSYSDQIGELTTDLERASFEVDRVLDEMSDVVKARQDSVSNLEAQLESLTKQEEEIRGRIETLKKVPVPAAEHFAAMVSKGERRAALRDYGLFGAVVLVSTLISIGLRLVGF